MGMGPEMRPEGCQTGNAMFLPGAEWTPASPFGLGKRVDDCCYFISVRKIEGHS